MKRMGRKGKQPMDRLEILQMLDQEPHALSESLLTDEFPVMSGPDIELCGDNPTRYMPEEGRYCRSYHGGKKIGVRKEGTK